MRTRPEPAQRSDILTHFYFNHHYKRTWTGVTCSSHHPARMQGQTRSVPIPTVCQDHAVPRQKHTSDLGPKNISQTKAKPSPHLPTNLAHAYRPCRNRSYAVPPSRQSPTKKEETCQTQTVPEQLLIDRTNAAACSPKPSTSHKHAVTVPSPATQGVPISQGPAGGLQHDWI